jgi:hypothetical protein
MSESESLEKLARTKLANVLGEARAQRIYGETIASLGMRELRTADDLYAFGELLATRGGFEAAVGGLLSVAAVVRGAQPRKSSVT